MNHIYSKFLLPIIVVLIYSITISAQTLSYKQFTEEDGLPSLTTYEIIQDSSGILWIGTENGLVSYDGEKFEKYQFPEFQDNDILQTFIHETGDVGFINLANEIGLIKGNEVLKFIRGDDGTDLIQLFKFQDGNYTVQSSFQNDSICTTYGFLKLENEVAFCDSSLIICHKSDQITEKKYSLNLSSEKEIGDKINKKSFNLIEKNKSGKMYCMASDNGISILSRSNQVCFSVKDDFIKSRDLSGFSFFTENNGNYLYLDNNKIYSYDTLSEKDVLLSDEFIYQYLYVDIEGVLWASTQNTGLIKFDNYKSPFEVIDEFKKEIVSINTTSNSFLVTTFDRAVLYDKAFGLRDEVIFRNSIKSIAHSSGNEFIISNQKDIINTSNMSFRVGQPIKVTPKDFIVFNNNFFIGALKGLITNKHIETANRNNERQISYYELLGKRVTKLKSNPSSSKLYIGTTKGLFLKQNSAKPELFCEDLQKEIISAIQEVNDSIVLVGTENHGLYKLINAEVVDIINVKQGLYSNSINDIAVDGNNVVIATNKGISLYDLKNDDIKNLTTFHGLSSNKISSLLFHEGYVVAGVGKSLMKIDIDDFNTSESTSILTMDKFLVNNIEVDRNDIASFSYDQNKIDIYYNNVSLRSSLFSKSLIYRIQEIDDKWEEVKEAAVRLPALQPGSYTVEAKGINGIGQESDVVELSFTIKPPWWQTIYARLLALAAILLVMFSINRYRINQFKKKEMVKRDYLTQINQIKDQALQLQMNPHFIFNSLNAIQNFIGTNDERSAINYLARFARLIRLIFEYSKNTQITLEQEIEFIQLYIDLEKLRFKDKVEVELNISEEIEENKDVLLIPPLLIQPIIENSFKHGLFHKIGVGKLYINYELNHNDLIITIQDNGIGRKAASKKNKLEDTEHVSSGVNTTKQRLDILSFGKDGNSNTIIIEDLMDVDNNPLGTKTVIKLDVS